MKLLPRILFVLAIVKLLTLTSCFKRNCDTSFISQEAKDFCAFHNGSQWIYEEEKSGAIDTHRLINMRTSLIGEEEGCRNDEQIVYDIVTSEFDFSIENRMGFSIHVWGGGSNDGEAQVDMSGNNSKSKNRLYYFESSDSAEVEKQSVKLRLLDSAMILGQSFNQVKVFEFDPQQPGEFEMQRIYWAKHVGIIRIQYMNGEIWNLKEFDVLQ